jgi:hypothetical protein
MHCRRFSLRCRLRLRGSTRSTAQNPWVAACNLAHAWSLYEPHVLAVLHWLLPVAGLAWVIVSGWAAAFSEAMGSGTDAVSALQMMVLQAAWLAALGQPSGDGSGHGVGGGDAHPAGEPDLVGFAFWAIFLSLGFFTVWALVSWPLSIAPIADAAGRLRSGSGACASLRLGKGFTGKLVEINLVMGIVKLALIVLAMVFSAAPLPFSDELGADALHWMWAAVAVIFYLVANDYFQVVRLKGFVEFWKMFRGEIASQRQVSKSSTRRQRRPIYLLTQPARLLLSERPR